jgi:sortase A
MRILIRLFSWVLLLGGIYVAYEGASDYYQSVNSQEEQALAWEDQSTETVQSLTHPGKKQSVSLGRNVPVKGASIAKLSIPRLDTVLYVVEGTDSRDLKRGPGHLEGTMMPGSGGNCVIAGHRDTHFRVLRNIAKGDEILVQSREGTFRYRVTEMSVVSPENTACLRPTSKGELNLVTCFPFEYVGNAPRRFVVHANLLQSSTAKS